MSGSTLSMAPAVEAAAPCHRSYSTPDLPALSDPTPPSAGSLSRDNRSLSLKSLPSLPSEPSELSFDLPSFDLPSFDLHSFDLPGFDFDRSSLPADSKNPPGSSLGPHPSQTETAAIVSAAAPEKPPPAADLDDTPGRKQSMIDKRRLWLSNSRSTPDVCDSLPGNSLGSPTVDDAAAAAGDARSGREPRPLERSKTAESLTGLAKKPWIPASSSFSSSPSRAPSPPRKSVSRPSPEDGAISLGNSWSTRATALSGASDAQPRPRTHSGLEREASQSSDALSSTSRALSRASEYFAKIKQRPQSVFVRSAAPPPPSSLSTSFTPSTFSAPSTPSSLSPSFSSFPVDSDNNALPPWASTLDLSSPGSTLAISSSAVDDTSSNNNYNTSSPSALLHANNTPTYTRSSSSKAASSCTSETDSSEDASQSTADTSLTMPHPTSRDPLWATFRNLEADFNRFAVKNSPTAKMGAVRASLVPFLHNTLHHPSNADKRALTPEDVDRRTTILSKWWHGLLEMLDGGQSRCDLGMSSVAPAAASDRPALLDVTAMIMARPEWRLSTSCFQPLADRSPFERVRARSSETDSADSGSDLDSTSSAFILESAEHNVRTMFVTNLLTQMAIVVDKMSMRHVPPSVVSWAGRACAYAFFFAPGVADVLVRLWCLRVDLIRRAADGLGLPRRNGGESDDLVALFPPNLGALGWTSAKTASDRLRLAAKLPLLAAKIPWHGPWVSRWRGGDTDLLFLFCKHYYLLAEDFTPPGLPLVERARAPAFVLLHAQLLATLDSTIHRHAALDTVLGPPLVDAPHGADASISALSLPANNLLRGMDENRLVVLLRDVLLAEHPAAAAAAPGTKLAFAEAFMCLLKAATKRTSRYEHASCFTLCDFLEEALAVYTTFESRLYADTSSFSTSPSLIDWPFWFDVAKLILTSNNTMAEIRMLSFIFAVWDSIAADPARKQAVCTDWLLSEEVFERFFNSWCPMVRAYYMRLLCWRICRDSGRASEPDVAVFLLVSRRLKTVWSHYLWLKQAADAAGRLPPSTAPCHPTPGKRFMIMRTEVQPPQPGLFVSSETPGGPPPLPPMPDQDNDKSRQLASSPFPGVDVNDGGGGSSDGGAPFTYKKKWTLLGKVLSLTTGGANSNNSNNAKRDWDDELDDTRRETAASRMVRAGVQLLSGPPAPPPKQGLSPASSGRPSSDSSSSTGSSPVFDDATRYVFRFTLAWQSQAAMAAGPPRDRILTRPRLPAPAQARVSARSAATTADRGAAAPNTAAFRSDSPPPIAAGLPLPTRRVSGVAHTGLISEARNARPLETDLPSQNASRRRSATLGSGISGRSERSESVGSRSSRSTSGNTADDNTVLSPQPSLSTGELSSARPPMLTLNLDFSDSELGGERNQDRAQPARVATMTTRTRAGTATTATTTTAAATTGAGIDAEIERQRHAVLPAKPTGIFAAGATYAGRALAEWSLVINECNSFVDRRRDEGILGLSEVEVPTLGVEGLGLRRPA